MADTMDSACPPGRSPSQRYLLFEGRDPSGKWPGALLTLLEGSHPGRPLGTADGHQKKIGGEIFIQCLCYSK